MAKIPFSHTIVYAVSVASVMLVGLIIFSPGNDAKYIGYMISTFTYFVLVSLDPIERM